MPTIIAVVTDLFFAVKVSDGAKRAGRAVKFANTIDQAMRLAREESPAMIVADLHCREVDVLELARQTKADPVLMGIPLLGFLSHVREDVKRAALAAGFDKVVARSTFSDKAGVLLAG